MLFGATILGWLNWKSEAKFCSLFLIFCSCQLFQYCSNCSCVKESLGNSSSFSSGFCCCSHSFFLRMLAKENEETCFPSLGWIEIFGGVKEVGGVGGDDSVASVSLIAGVSSALFLGWYSASGSATLTAVVWAAVGVVFDLDWRKKEVGIKLPFFFLH